LCGTTGNFFPPLAHSDHSSILNNAILGRQRKKAEAKKLAKKVAKSKPKGKAKVRSRKRKQPEDNEESEDDEDQGGPSDGGSDGPGDGAAADDPHPADDLQPELPDSRLDVVGGGGEILPPAELPGVEHRDHVALAAEAAVEGAGMDEAMEDAQAEAAEPAQAPRPPAAAAAAPAAAPPPAPEVAAAPRRAGGVFERLNFSPVEILQRLVPNSDFRLYVDQNQYRWKVECQVTSPKFVHPYDKKHFSRVFTKETWKSSLSTCHKYMWEKCNLRRDESPPDKPWQSEVPSDVLDMLAPIVAQLPNPKDYSK
jgi:hypothetical protein